ncbi:dynactin subunit 1-like protein [Tanacetum coccineum]
MALRRSRLTLIFINVILFFALCAKPISSQGEDVPAPPLPKLDLQKSLGSGDPAKMVIDHLQFLKPAIENYKQWFPQRKACWKSQQSAQHCYDQCQENYGAASDFATGTIESLNKQDLPTAKCDVSNIATNVQKCQDCFEQTGTAGDQAMTDINMWVKEQAQWCVDVLKTVNGVQKLSVDQNDKEEEVPPPSLPKIGVQKSLGDQNGDPTKMAITHLEHLKASVEDYRQWFPQRKACWKVPDSAKACYDQCIENYGVASDLITSSIESLNKQDLPKAKSDISNIATSIQKCQDCFEQTGNGGDQYIKDINMWVKGQAEWCLDNMLNTVENGVQKLSVDQNDKEEVPPPSLPKLDLQKSLGSGDPAKMVIDHLQFLKPAIENYKQWFPQRKACWKSSQSAKHCYDQCQENYGVALDFVTGSIESLNKKDLPKAKCDIGNVNTNIQKCQDCFEQTGNGGDQAMTDINMWVKEQSQWCLDVLSHVNGVQKLSVDQNDDATKRAIEQLEGIKHDL